jgi:hypothetical protein
LQLQVSAGDDLGVVTQVVVMVNQESLPQCYLTTVPYACWWDVPAANKKTYVLQALAYDPSGNIGISDMIKVHTDDKALGIEEPEPAAMPWHPKLGW